MTENNALDFSRKQMLDHIRGGGIRKMAMARLDSLFHRPRPMFIVLQKFFVMICLDYKRVHFAQSLDDHLGRITEVCDETEAARASVKSEPDRIDGIMRHGKRLNRDIADRKL